MFVSDKYTNSTHPAYCGFDCGECPMYQATVNDDAELKKALIARYSTKDKTLTEADIVCFGCKSDKRYVHPFCEQCRIRLCAIAHELSSNCGECADYPCDEIINRIPLDSPSRCCMNEIHSGIE